MPFRFPNAAGFNEFLQTRNNYDFVIKKVKILTAIKGNCTAELKIEEEHTNAKGALHGGFSATLVDNISSFALLTSEAGSVPSVSVDMHINYLKGAKIGDSILINAKLIEAKGNLAVLDVDIVNKLTNEVLVKGRHTKCLI